MLQRGLSGVHVAERLAGLVGVAHEDLVDWFMWHDGSRPGSFWMAAPTGSGIVPLDSCLRLRDEMLKISLEPGIARWHPHWLPLTDGPAAYTLDMTTGQFLLVDWWGEDFVSTPAADLASAVSVWVQALKDGHYRWADDHWDYDFAGFPLSLRVGGLVG